MRVKDATVQCTFAPVLTALLFGIDHVYREIGSELVITSGNEETAKHSYTSLHYATPGQAADLRSWEIHDGPTSYNAEMQVEIINKVVDSFCEKLGFSRSWVEVILEHNHIHIEYQPKRHPVHGA